MPIIDGSQSTGWSWLLVVIGKLSGRHGWPSRKVDVSGNWEQTGIGSRELTSNKQVITRVESSSYHWKAYSNTVGSWFDVPPIDKRTPHVSYWYQSVPVWYRTGTSVLPVWYQSGANLVHIPSHRRTLPKAYQMPLGKHYVSYQYFWLYSYQITWKRQQLTRAGNGLITCPDTLKLFITFHNYIRARLAGHPPRPGQSYEGL